MKSSALISLHKKMQKSIIISALLFDVIYGLVTLQSHNVRIRPHTHKKDYVSRPHFQQKLVT